MKTYQEICQHIDASIDKNRDELFRLNTDIASHPELSGEEYETTRKIRTVLEQHGFSVTMPFDGMDTAFFAVSGSNHHKYKIAILAEYDALPEIGHGCGHCLSGSISCLAGIALSDLQDELDADIHIIGTPAEETVGKKAEMAAHGVFDPYDMAIMVHLYNENLPSQIHQALLESVYTFHGKAAHAASNPWDGINALNAVQLMFHAVDMLRQHITPDARLHGYISNGGSAPNVVPDTAECEFYVRALHKEYARELLRKLDDIAKGACLMTGATVDKTVKDNPFDDFTHNRFGDECLQEVYDEIGLPRNGHPDKIFGSSDAANVSTICPTFHACLQLSPQEIPIHTREFAGLTCTEKGRECLVQGAKIISHQIAKIFGDEENIRKMKSDFGKAVRK